MASCGGSAKKAEESKAVVYAKNIIDAELKGDRTAEDSLYAELVEYMSTLSEEEIEKFKKELWAETDKYVSTLSKEDKVKYEENTIEVEVDNIIYYASVAATEKTLAAKIVGEWFGDASGPLTLNKDGKFTHTLGAAAWAVVEGGSWSVNCMENQKSLILKYSSGDVVTCYINDETLVSTNEETFTRL